MLARLRTRLAHAIAPAPSGVRRFDAAAGGRRAFGFGSFGRTQTEVSAAAPIVRSRARALAANNPHIGNAVGNWVSSLVGTGIMPTGDADQVNRFLRWGTDCDADGRTDFSGIQEAIARAMVVDGEAFVRVHTTDMGVRLQLIPAEMVDESRTVELRDGGYIVNGVEFDASGLRVAYWVLPARPTDQFATYLAPVRVAASDMLHIFRPIGVGQVRGISWLAPIVVPASEFDAIVDALAVGVKVAALNCAFAVDQNGNAAGNGPYDLRQPAGHELGAGCPAHPPQWLGCEVQRTATGE
jgi:lambda family phage portal protein